MAHTFYHNITLKEFNVLCVIDFLDKYKDGDILMKSEAGCALIKPITDEELEEMLSEWEEYYNEE